MTLLTGITEPRSLDEAIGQRAHQVMFLKRITAREMAPVLGVSASVVGRKLRGQVAWSAGDVVAAARHLNVGGGFLLGETDDPRPVGPDGDHVEYTPWDSNPEPSD
ncbi:helix-turn-helix domain-containing protein [Occultella kanbiaonis]